MQLNRSTIVLLVASLIVIIGVLVINSNQASAPADETPTASPQTGGPVFSGVTADTLTRFEIRDNTTGARSVFTRTSDESWTLDDTISTTDTSGGLLDQAAVLSDIEAFLALEASDSFDSSELSGFGLVNPAHSLLASSEDGISYVLHIGGQNPSGNRYYAVLEQLAEADVTDASATEEPLAVATTIVGDDDAEAGTSDNIQGAELTDLPDAEATGDPEPTPDAEATDDLELTPEVTAPAAFEPTATLAPLAEPLVVLEGTQTIYTLPKTAVDALIAFLTAPPTLIPTAEATEEAPVLEATAEATPEADVTPDTEATEEAARTVEATEEPAS